MMKRIKELRTEKGMSVPQSRQGTRSEISYNEGVSSKPVSNNVYEELPGPDEIQQKPKPQKTSTNVGESNLGEGTFDEDESHQGFLEAL